MIYNEEENKFIKIALRLAEKKSLASDEYMKKSRNKRTEKTLS